MQENSTGGRCPPPTVLGLVGVFLWFGGLKISLSASASFATSARGGGILND
jgi:hypothetical protein